jgi:molybdopterin converting factor small subunit
MKIQIIYTAMLKSAVGASDELVEISPGSTLKECLLQLISLHGQPLGSMLLRDGNELQPSIILCLGNEQVLLEHPNPLQDGDELTILSAISGG